MDYSGLRSQFNNLYKKHARSNVVDTSWLGRGLSPEEIIKAEKMLKCALPDDIKLISAEISSFLYEETPYFMDDLFSENLCSSLNKELQDDLRIQSISSILDWGQGDGGDSVELWDVEAWGLNADFAELWDIEVDLVSLYVEKERDVIVIGEINSSNVINRDVVPIGFSSEGTLYINLYDHTKNIGSVVNLVQWYDEIIIHTLSNSYGNFIENMLTSLKRRYDV
jgi:hypothetical protein